MNDFSHEELQQVIRKYDSEYKRFKKIANGKPIFVLKLTLENGAKITELEERCQRAEKDNVKLKDQALCYQENVDRLKGKLFEI
jgi:hypothetical protein